MMFSETAARQLMIVAFLVGNASMFAVLVAVQMLTR